MRKIFLLLSFSFFVINAFAQNFPFGAVTFDDNNFDRNKIDSNANAVVDPVSGTIPADEILQVFQSANNYPIKFQNEANQVISSLSFTSQGFVRNDIRAYATFCSPTSESIFTHGLTIERSGRLMKAAEISFDTGSGKNAIAINCD
ncbi:MAG: hypothetical protein EOO68_10495 [Moraxellaceae bacterium]|nr:MAG: hypothetical protein EOO68_10495 [Moraxellaceae bacterium]